LKIPHKCTAKRATYIILKAIDPFAKLEATMIETIPASRNG